MESHAEKWKSKKSVLLLLGLFAAGLIFLFASEYIWNDENKNSNASVFDEEAYIAKLETRLCEIISEIKGVSNVKVMVALETSVSYSYAEETSKSVGTDSNRTDSSLLFQQDKNGAKSPILTAVVAPRIRGVSVVCKGGSGGEIQAKIISLISRTLNLSKSRIYITE